MFRFAPVIIGIAVLMALKTAAADDSSAPRVVDPGEFRALAAGGISIIDRDPYLAMDGSFEVGLLSWLELAAPLALSARIIETSPGSGLYLSGGVVDLNVTNEYNVLFAPALVLVGQAVLGPESALRGAVDITSVRSGFERDAVGVYLRGSFAVLIDFGPYATLAMGLSYQRGIRGGPELADDVIQSGWVADSRVSIGAVRSQPFYDLPTLSIHLGDSVDIIALARFDIDQQRDTTDIRILAGLELH